MNGALRRVDPASAWLTLGIVVALGLAALPWFLPLGHANRAAVTMATPTPLPALMARLPALDTLPETRQRPLFSPDRKAIVSAPAAETGPNRLVGIVGASGARRAMLRDAAGTRMVGAGDRLDAWTVQSVEADRLVLSRGAEQVILSIGSALPAGPGGTK
ncbi:MAG: hypothetical protein EXQ92_11290 [Alphaproteobacteria bacterium]|nr:hypothetical protein [Alphaproteobacteria bacterium]